MLSYDIYDDSFGWHNQTYYIILHSDSNHNFYTQATDASAEVQLRIMTMITERGRHTTQHSSPHSTPNTDRHRNTRAPCEEVNHKLFTVTFQDWKG